MANNRVIGGKVVGKRGGGGWRRGRGARSTRGSGSDEDASDEEYVVGGDGEGEEVESSDDSYSSDASREASQDAEDTACSDEEEDEEEEEYGLVGGEEIEAARGRRTRKGMADAGRRRRAVAPLVVVEVEEAAEAPPLRRKSRAMQRHRSVISAEEEGEEFDDADDEDFAPDEDDDDEEEPVRAPLRKPGGGKNSPVKRQRKKGRPRNSNLREKSTKAPAKKKRRRRIAATSDDDDFVVKDRRTSVEATTRKKEKGTRSRRIPSVRQRRRPWALRFDPSESDSSDFDYAIPVEESRDLRVRRSMGHLLRRPLSSALQGEKGKGKDDGDLGKQVCGVCLSEEKKGIVQGLLDCCTHYFCFACIMEWSKVESRCPLCKRRFKTVRKAASSDAGFCLRTAVINIPERDQVYQPSEEEIRGYLDPYANVVCMECQQGGDDNLILLCDICDSPAHTYCVGLGREVPEGNWYCDGCRSVDAGSSDLHVQSVVEHGVRSDWLRVSFHGETVSENASIGMPHEPAQRLATLPCDLPSNETGEAASSRYPSLLRDHETALRIPGFTASTVSGRRSIHRRIRTMISINRIRWIPEGITRDNAVQPSGMGSDVFGYETEHHGDTFCAQQDSLTNRLDERSSRSFLGPRANMHPCMHNGGSSCHMVEAAKDFSQQ